MPTVSIRAGERTRIIRKLSNSLATEYELSVQPVNPGESVSGEIEVSGSSWLFPKTPERMPLQAENIVRKGTWDTLYSVYVRPESDVIVSVTGGSVKSRFLYLIIAIVIVAVVAAVLPLVMS